MTPLGTPPPPPAPQRWPWAGWLLVALALGCGVVCAFVWRGAVSLEQLKAAQLSLAQTHASQPWGVSAAYFALFTGLTALCLPGCGLLLLLGGSTFGLVWGSALSVLASTLGATLTMLAARHALRPWVRRHLGHRLADFDREVQQGGAHHLLSLRLLPVIPFVPVNLMAGVTELRVSTFFWVSLVGMLPGTVVYVHAGQALAQVKQLADVWSPTAMASIGLLAVLPLATRWWAVRLRARLPLGLPANGS